MRSIKLVCRNTVITNKSWGIDVGGESLEKLFKKLLKEYDTDEILCDFEVHIMPKESIVKVDVGTEHYASLEDFEEAMDEQKIKKADPEI